VTEFKLVNPDDTNRSVAYVCKYLCKDLDARIRASKFLGKERPVKPGSMVERQGIPTRVDRGPTIARSARSESESASNVRSVSIVDKRETSTPPNNTKENSFSPLEWADIVERERSDGSRQEARADGGSALAQNRWGRTGEGLQAKYAGADVRSESAEGEDFQDRPTSVSSILMDGPDVDDTS
jgi:hypothetical protein